MFKSNQGSTDFDFDAWRKLASEDPDEFERKRQATIDEFLRNVPESKRRRLRGLQFRIDMERRRARTPMGACIKISSMMWDSLVGPEGLTTALNSLIHGGHYPIKEPASSRRSAHIVAFSRTDSSAPRN